MVHLHHLREDSVPLPACRGSNAHCRAFGRGVSSALAGDACGTVHRSCLERKNTVFSKFLKHAVEKAVILAAFYAQERPDRMPHVVLLILLFWLLQSRFEACLKRRITGNGVLSPKLLLNLHILQLTSCQFVREEFEDSLIEVPHLVASLLPAGNGFLQQTIEKIVRDVLSPAFGSPVDSFWVGFLQFFYKGNGVMVVVDIWDMAQAEGVLCLKDGCFKNGGKDALP